MVFSLAFSLGAGPAEMVLGQTFSLEGTLLNTVLRQSQTQRATPPDIVSDSQKAKETCCSRPSITRKLHHAIGPFLFPRLSDCACVETHYLTEGARRISFCPLKPHVRNRFYKKPFLLEPHRRKRCSTAGNVVVRSLSSRNLPHSHRVVTKLFIKSNTYENVTGTYLYSWSHTVENPWKRCWSKSLLMDPHQRRWCCH